MSDSETIKEGFLCPVCHKDLRSPTNLIAHFQDLHSEEQDILKSIKEIYGKAKKKILKADEHDLESSYKAEPMRPERYLFLESSAPAEPGHSRSHTDYFKEIRRERLDHRTTETNKLIIRLDRLLQYYGPDRKQKEQELVAWLDGSTVTRCPSCASSFNITRRQHHCRLCGSIMCNSCSYFLSYETAQTIVAPVNNRQSVEAKEADSLRICNHCLDMLECRRRVQIDQMVQPIICQLYSHLQKLKQQTQNSVDLYLKMHDSLSAGESTFQIQDTQSLRATIAKNAELIDTISKKIATISVAEESPKVAQLQTNIRRATSAYIKDYLLTLPVPPTLEELARIRRSRLQKNEDEPLSLRPNVIKKVTVTTGWSPSNFEKSSGGSHDEETDEDPLIEQMNIVRNYIEQAKRAQRFEEVVSLKENLRFLKEAYRKQQSSRGHSM